MIKNLLIIILLWLLWTDACCKKQHTVKESSRAVSLDTTTVDSDWVEEQANSGIPTIKK